jgi:hypothetical protein
VTGGAHGAPLATKETRSPPKIGDDLRRVSPASRPCGMPSGKGENPAQRDVARLAPDHVANIAGGAVLFFALCPGTYQSVPSTMRTCRRRATDVSHVTLHGELSDLLTDNGCICRDRCELREGL